MKTFINLEYDKENEIINANNLEPLAIKELPFCNDWLGGLIGEDYTKRQSKYGEAYALGFVGECPVRVYYSADENELYVKAISHYPLTNELDAIHESILNVFGGDEELVFVAFITRNDHEEENVITFYKRPEQ